MITLPLLGLIFLIAVATFVIFFQIAYAFQVGNISDGFARFSIAEQEDMSVEIYRTVNGNTVQVAGHDNLSSAIGGLIVIEALRGTAGMIANLTSQFIIPQVYASSGGVSVTSPSGMSQDSAVVVFNASWSNGTVAHLSENMSSIEASQIVLAINAILNGLDLEDIAEELPEEEEPESSESEDSDGGGGGSSDNPIEPDESQNPEPDENGNGTNNEAEEESGAEVDSAPEQSEEPEAELEETNMTNPYNCMPETRCRTFSL